VGWVDGQVERKLVIDRLDAIYTEESFVLAALIIVPLQAQSVV
jgi:hypothetical protein